MPIFERSIDIDAPLETVFAFHLDTRNVPRITPPTQQVTQIEGTFPLVLGAEVQMLLRQDPIPTAQPWKIRVTALEEPTLIVDELFDNPNFLHFIHTHRFAPNATGGTTLTDHIDWEMPNSMAGRMATPIAKGILEKVFTARQERTKVLLEENARRDG